jgi:hypothetical protein
MLGVCSSSSLKRCSLSRRSCSRRLRSVMSSNVFQALAFGDVLEHGHELQPFGRKHADQEVFAQRLEEPVKHLRLPALRHLGIQVQERRRGHAVGVTGQPPHDGLALQPGVAFKRRVDVQDAVILRPALRVEHQFVQCHALDH